MELYFIKNWKKKLGVGKVIHVVLFLLFPLKYNIKGINLERNLAMFSFSGRWNNWTNLIRKPDILIGGYENPDMDMFKVKWK